MSKTASSESTPTEYTIRSKWDDWTIMNTFAPNCGNKYFTPPELFCLFRFGGVSFNDLPEEGKKMVRAYEKEYSKKRTNLKELPKRLQECLDDPNITIAGRRNLPFGFDICREASKIR